MDAHATSVLGVPTYELMCRAGAAAWRLLHQRWPQAQVVGVACGPGNNGGDGYVVARAGPRRRLPRGAGGPAGRQPALGRRTPGAGRLARRRRQRHRLRRPAARRRRLGGRDLRHRPDAPAVRGRAGHDRAHQRQPRCRCSRWTCPRAWTPTPGTRRARRCAPTLTLSFIAAKRGLYTGMARDFDGEVLLDRLDLKIGAFDDYRAGRLAVPPRRPGALAGSAASECAQGRTRPRALRRRRRGHGRRRAAVRRRCAAHRRRPGQRGHAPVRRGGAGGGPARGHDPRGGGRRRPGAAGGACHRAGRGARAGAGRVGRSRCIARRWPAAVRWCSMPMRSTCWPRRPASLPQAILTPHPGEAARLLGCEKADIQADRFGCGRRAGAEVPLRGGAQGRRHPRGRARRDHRR